MLELLILNFVKVSWFFRAFHFKFPWVFTRFDLYLYNVNFFCLLYQQQVCRGPWMSTVVLYCWGHSDSASVLLYFIFLSHLFPLPCGAGSTVPREGFDSSVIMPFPGVLWLWHFQIVSAHIKCQTSIYTFVVSRAFMAGVASQPGDADSSRAPGLTSGL